MTQTTNEEINMDEKLLLTIAAILAIGIGIAYFTGLFSIYTGSINTIKYTAANIDIPTRVFQNETLKPKFVATAIPDPTIYNGSGAELTGGIERYPMDFYRLSYAWFLDGKLITYTPAKNETDKWAERGYTYKVLDGYTAETNNPPTLTIPSGTLSKGKHTIEYKSYLFNKSQCGEYRKPGEGWTTDFSLACPYYTDNGPTTVTYSRDQTTLQLNRTYEQMLTTITPEYKTIVSEQFDVLSLPLPPEITPSPSTSPPPSINPPPTTQNNTFIAAIIFGAFFLAVFGIPKLIGK